MVQSKPDVQINKSVDFFINNAYTKDVPGSEGVSALRPWLPLPFFVVWIFGGGIFLLFHSYDERSSCDNVGPQANQYLNNIFSFHIITSFLSIIIARIAC